VRARVYDENSYYEIIRRIICRKECHLSYELSHRGLRKCVDHKKGTRSSVTLRDAHQDFLEAIIILLPGIQQALTDRVGTGVWLAWTSSSQCARCEMQQRQHCQQTSCKHIRLREREREKGENTEDQDSFGLIEWSLFEGKSLFLPAT